MFTCSRLNLEGTETLALASSARPDQLADRRGWLGAISLIFVLLANTVENAEAQGAKGPGTLAVGQTVMLAPGVEASTRFAERLSVPVAHGRTQSIMVTLGDWQLGNSAHEIRVPAQNFSYLADLRTGNVITTIGNERVTRHTGEVWMIPAGQAMTVTLRPPQESVGLRIFTLQPLR